MKFTISIELTLALRQVGFSQFVQQHVCLRPVFPRHRGMMPNSCFHYGLTGQYEIEMSHEILSESDKKP